MLYRKEGNGVSVICRDINEELLEVCRLLGITIFQVNGEVKIYS